MELGKHVLDKELLCKDGLRGGKVDDLLLDLGEPCADGTLPPPEVVAIIAGPMALSQTLSRPLRWLARQVYRLLGLPDPQPVEIPWRAVTSIDVVVHLDVDRDAAGLTALRHAVVRRYISRIPGS